jgi:Cys-rich repeat protein
MRSLVFVALVALAGCKGTPVVTTDGPPDSASPTPTGELETAPREGGRMAKPGWCQEDKDCPSGQVCESCGEEKSCVQGCHINEQCGAGQRCNQVQCIRCPCPGQCEAIPEGGGTLK